MPIIRYFVAVGGALLALLFAADRYLPAPIERAGEADLDRTTIRIRSARSLPEKIIFDTRFRPDNPAVAAAEPTAEQRLGSAREALAAMPAAPAPETKKEPPARRRAEARAIPGDRRSCREDRLRHGWRSIGTTFSQADCGELSY
ncbi:hypothetical protein [Bradyrhizobium sp. Rc3b]|uniref:hypothetical protein n=1 Tax=Bradyrhizobium sp. Rc3b TaxID=1855322 RepID=UPI000A4EFD90|nr:hypothetical protein [Bradyrhizobium sp. Rc3b]